ncbi:MAG TPA: DUF2460 domain-containing protein [Anaerolineales bacterium]|nr:DUF2460 domain-containing protein [Anaerolineales bacterium]
MAYGFTGGPGYKTDEVIMDNGGDQRNSRWLWPQHRYAAEFMNLGEEARDAIIAMFHVCIGKANAFRFKDWNDFTTDKPWIGPQTLAPVVGTTIPVQLYRTYEVGIYTKIRKITAPVVETIVIKRNGGAAGVTITIDQETGLATPSANWPAGTYTWEGEYDVWVNFSDDYNAFTINNWRAHTADIELVENKGLG